jgi:hypothetical protein
MTAKCIASLMPTLHNIHAKVVTVANAPERRLTEDELLGAEELFQPTNTGFGPGVNAAIKHYEFFDEFKDVLVLNNDLVFEQESWLANMLDARAKDIGEGFKHYAYAPATSCTATLQAVQDGPEDKPPLRLPQVSAYCWLITYGMCRHLDAKFDTVLFPPEFPNYGSDDGAAAMLRKCFGATPFQLVRRSWVRHLKAQTANALHEKAGTKELLTRLKKWKRSNGMS